MSTDTKPYGHELILDIHDVPGIITRVDIGCMFNRIGAIIGADLHDIHFWDYEDDIDGYRTAPKHMKGITAVQFLSVSNITIHCLDELHTVYFNIFSCKSFDKAEVHTYVLEATSGRIVKRHEIERL